jgi:hypothetical protein
MKKTVLVVAILAFSLGSFAQAKKDTTKQKAVYEKFIKVQVGDYRQLIDIANDYKTQVKYNALMEPADKIAIQVNIEKYLFELSKKVKIDSVLSLKK